MMRYIFLTGLAGLILSLIVTMGGCSGSGSSGFGIGHAGSTVISGKVTLSSSVISSKAALLTAMYNAPVGKPGSKAFHAPKRATNALAASLSPLQTATLSGAKVDMYDADHPEWLYPVATGTVDANGDYSLSQMVNSASNQNATYADGDPIPAGRYTLVAYKFTVGQKPMAAVQSLVREYNGDSTVNFEIIPSDVNPVVTTMFGLKKNTDGTQTWGAEEFAMPSNAAVQVSFSMPIWRDSLSGISIAPAVDGKWTLSPDWLTATFYPDVSSSATNTMMPGTTYTVTVNGADACATCPKVTNVYENAVLKTAVGTFTATDADTIPPVAQWNKPSIFDLANNSTVDVTQPFRIEAPKQLDVNTLTLKGTPDIGARPGVVFIGKSPDNLYVYEFVLGAPLQLDTKYTLTVTGGKDLAGNIMNDLNLTVKTVKESQGITVGQTQDWRNIQAAIKTVFGRWVQAMNDRNIGTIQGLMTGDFTMDYNTAYGINITSDLNRDGKFSFAEFTNMMLNDSFPNWDYCGTTIQGDIVGDINYYPAGFTTSCPLGECGDFEFKLTAQNLVNTQRCQDAAPASALYAEVKYVNNSWKIVHASQGIDTRGGKSVSASKKIFTHLWSRTGFFYTEQPDGTKLDGVPEQAGLRIKLAWDAIPDVTSYALLLIDARNPQQGMAWAFPPSVRDIDSRTDPGSLGGVDVSSKFGLGAVQNPMNPGSSQQFTLSNLIPGGQYYWVVLGFSSAVTNDQDVQYIENKRITDILNDVLGVSTVNTFSVAGVYQQLYVKVQPGSNPQAALIDYSEAFNGYDLNAAPNATLTIASPNYSAGLGFISVEGSTRMNYPGVQFSWDADLGMYQAQEEIALYKGVNQITMCDNQSWSYWGTLCKWFYIQTTGGIAPDISIWEVIDSANATLSDNSGWNFYKATTNAQFVTINGAVSQTAFDTLPADPDTLNNPGGKILQLNIVGPDFSAGSQTVQVKDDTNHTFSVVVDVYNTGYNWITLSNDTPYYVARMGVYSTNGTTWVPDIGITQITDASTDSTPGRADMTADYGISSDWNAAADPSNGYMITIYGKMKNPANGKYNVQSDGGYTQGNVTVDSGGNFSLNVVLYNGLNFVNLFDNGNNHWYGLSILTTNGKPVIRPVVTGVNGPAPVNSSATVNTCYATITGTAESGPLSIYWNGSADGNWYSEYYSMATDGNPDGTGKDTFTVVVPVVSGTNGSYNYVNINDLNYRNVSVQITTSATSCAYTPPMPTVTAVKDDQGNTLTPDQPGQPGRLYDAGGSQYITVEGAMNRSVGTVDLQGYLCGLQLNYPATTTNTTWSMQIPLYGGTQLQTGYNLYGGSYSAADNFNVKSTNTNTITPPIQVTTVTGKDAGGNSTTITPQGSSCGYSSWNVGTAVTISITGTMIDTSGQYQDTMGAVRPLSVASSHFTITDVPVYQTPSANSIYIWDSKNRNYSLTAYTSNGLTKPKFIDITSPAPGASVSGATPVTFTVQDPLGGNWTPATIYGYTYDSYAGSRSFGTYDGSILPTGNQGEYTFTTSFTQNYYGYVDVYGSDGSTWHEMYLFVNNGNTSKYWTKPGAGTSPSASPFEAETTWRRGMTFKKLLLNK